MPGRTTEFALTQKTLMDVQRNVSVLVMELSAGGSPINGASQSSLYPFLALVNKDYIVNEKCVCMSVCLFFCMSILCPAEYLWLENDGFFLHLQGNFLAHACK